MLTEGRGKKILHLHSGAEGWGGKVAGLGKEKVEGVEGVGGQGEWEVKEEEFITSRVVLMPPLKEAEVRVAGIPLLLNTQ